MSETINQIKENQKTIITFISGLLIGALLVWVFGTPSQPSTKHEGDKMEEKESPSESMKEEKSTPEEGKEMTVSAVGGSIAVSDQAAGDTVTLGTVVYPSNEGWIGVREYVGGQMTGLLGVARFNKAEGLSPTSVELLRSTVAGSKYAVVFYSDNGDKKFNLANDVQMDGVLSTFSAE